MNPVVHFEIPVKDRKRMADFYTQVFGWRTQMLGLSVFGDMGTSPLYTLKTVFVELGVVLHRTVFSVIEKA